MNDDRIKDNPTVRDEDPDETPRGRATGADKPSAETIPPPLQRSEPTPQHSAKTIPPPSTTNPMGSDHQLANRGNRLAGRYELQELIGEGGMGMVYRAHDMELDETIAIKLLQRQFTQNPEDVTRFKREIKTARRITHRNIIRIHDFGIADREAFISMELLGGGTLAERVARDGVNSEEALRIAIEVADGLGAAHAQGVIHRDIKPHNVLFDDNGTVKLVDFGIARFAASTAMTAGIMGTPHYMSPEQADGQPITQQSDVYSLGVLLFELFTEELPFQSESLAKLAVMHVSAEPPKPRSIDPSIPAELEEIILRCMQKDKAARYANGSEVSVALRRFRGDASDVRPVASGPRSPRQRQGRRSGGVSMFLGVILVLVLGGVVTGYVRPDLVPAPLVERFGLTQSTPTPAPTLVVAATPTPQPTVANTPTSRRRQVKTRRSRRTPKTTPKKTPRPVISTPKPTATPKPVAKVLLSKLVLYGQPAGKIYVNGGLCAESPAAAVKCTVGKNGKVKPGVYSVRLEYTNPTTREDHSITTKVDVKPNRDMKLIWYIPDSKLLVNQNEPLFKK